MNNSIYKKIRTHMLVIGGVTAAVFTVLITAGLLVTRQTTVSAGNRFGDSAAQDARKILIEQTENELSRLAQSKAAFSDEQLSVTAEHVRTISQIAATIKSNPAKYGRREISFPDTANTEGKVTAMMQIPNEHTDISTLRNEIGLMANIQDALIAIQSNYKSAATTTVATELGLTVNSDPNSALKTPYFEPRQRPWYLAAKEAKGMIWTDVFEDYLGRGLAISCAMPFYDGAGNIAGVVSMGTFLTTLSNEVVGTKIGETGYAFMVDQKGDVIISDTIVKDEDGKIIRENILKSDTFPHETAQKMINGKNGIEHVVMDGKEKFIAYHGLTTVPWSLAVIIEVEEIIAPALMLESNIISLKQSALSAFGGYIRLISIFAGIILGFIVAGVLFFSERLARVITDPIQKLTSEAALIGAGDLDHILAVKTGDELEILADSFNSMITGIKTITAEKVKEQEANQLKSRFLATMSHEIRTPLNVIMGITEIKMQKEDTPPDTIDSFEKIYESGNLLLNIINDILDLSKITEGKMEIVPLRYDIPSMINDTAQLSYLRCESKPIEFIVSVDANTPLELEGDALRIKQILNNLLSNAFKYTEEGEVELSVFSEPAEGNEDEIIVFCVRDTGQGISEEHIGRLFEDYARFNRDKSRTVTGTGLGLSITKRLIDLMNGEISVESQLDKGSVFTVRLPQKRFGKTVCGAENARRLREFDFNSTAITRKTQVIREYMPYGSVLIVDDVKSNLFVAKGLLLPYGLQIDAVDNGAEAVSRIKGGNVYDVIFMDHMMPVMDGIEAVKIIRSTGYDRPIVALTANALVGQAEMFMQNGFDGFISKPIDSRRLNAVLNEFIRNKKPPEVVEAARQELSKKEKGETEGKTKLSEIEKYFLLDAGNAVNKLEEIYTKTNSLDETDIESYKIIVHSMKSALANIGEAGLSETAGRLEQSAIEKNLAARHEETSAFIGALKSLIKKLKEKLDSAKAGDAAGEDVHITAGDTAYLREKLLEIKTACETMEKKAAKTALNDLKQNKWPHRINDALDKISVHLLHSDFTKAGAAAENVIKDV